MSKLGNWRHLAKALSYRDHRLFNATLVPTLTSQWAQRTGIGWLAWDLTHSPTWLGIIAAADLLPAVVLSPFAGALADRSVPVRMMRVTQGIFLIHGLVLWLLTAGGHIDIWMLLVLSLLIGINQPYSTAARMVFYPTLVPREQLATAVAINSTVFNAGRAIGPAIAGVMIAPFGVAAVFFLTFAAFVAHMVNLYRIHPKTAERNTAAPKGMAVEIAEGLRYTARHPGIGPILLLLVVASMVSRPLAEMLPGFADEVFSRGAEGLGWMLMAMGVGGFLAAVWLTGRGPVQGLTKVVLWMTLLMGLSIAGFGMVTNFWAGLVLLTILGFALVTSGTGTQSFMMTSVASHMRGRVMSLYGAVFRGIPAIGAIILGAVAEVVGLSLAVLGAGVICIIAWAFTTGRRGSLAKALETPPKE
jgi:predicted MFS family arabinose efflux permease